MNSQNSKSEAIKAAYGELYIKHKPDENGWVKWNIKNDFGEENVESKVKGEKLIYRLKILRGIETNNGWTRVEDEMKNLPYDYSRCMNDKCKLRHNCLRFIDRPDVILSFVAFIPKGDTCENLIENK